MLTNTNNCGIIILSKDNNQRRGGKAELEEKGGYMEVMTDKQFDKIMKMVSMILEGCKDLDEAKEKIKELAEEQKKEKAD